MSNCWSAVAAVASVVVSVADGGDDRWSKEKMMMWSPETKTYLELVDERRADER